MRRLFANLFRHHMDRAGLTPTAMADAVGLSRSYVYGIRDGRLPSARRVVALADALRLTGEDRLTFIAAAAWASAAPALVALLDGEPMAKVGKLLDRASR